jgi:hypothetical protein
MDGACPDNSWAYKFLLGALIVVESVWWVGGDSLTPWTASFFVVLC